MPALVVALAPGVSQGADSSGGGFVWLVLPIVAFVIWIVVAGVRRGFFRGGGAVGNALNDLNSMLMPNRPDAAVMHELDEHDERDDAGDDKHSR